jgi:hypothetical protein
MAPIRRHVACLLAAGLCLLAGCGGGADNPAPERTPATQASADENVVIRLKRENGSATSGTATLNGGDRGYSVTIAVRPKRDHPAHIHDVTCDEYRATKGFDAKLDTVAESLSDLSKGRSETSVDAPLSLVRTGAFSINVHSYTGGYPVVACANIPAA